MFLYRTMHNDDEYKCIKPATQPFIGLYLLQRSFSCNTFFLRWSSLNQACPLHGCPDTDHTLGSRGHNTGSCTRANVINISASGWEALAESGVVLTTSFRSVEKLLKSMSPFWIVAVLACHHFDCHCFDLLSIRAIKSLKNGTTTQTNQSRGIHSLLL